MRLFRWLWSKCRWLFSPWRRQQRKLLRQTKQSDSKKIARQLQQTSPQRQTAYPANALWMRVCVALDALDRQDRRAFLDQLRQVLPADFDIDSRQQIAPDTLGDCIVNPPKASRGRQPPDSDVPSGG